jgi:hypothetical protein
MSIDDTVFDPDRPEPGSGRIPDKSRTSRLRRGRKVLKERYHDATIHELSDYIACILPHGDSITLYGDYVHYQPEIWIRHSDAYQSLEFALLLVDRIRESISRTDFLHEIVSDPGMALDPPALQRGSGPMPKCSDSQPGVGST